MRPGHAKNSSGEELHRGLVQPSSRPTNPPADHDAADVSKANAAVFWKPVAQYGGTQAGFEQQRQAACAERLAAVQQPQPAQLSNPVGLSLSQPTYTEPHRTLSQGQYRADLKKQARDTLHYINQLAEVYNLATESVQGFATKSLYNRLLIQQWRHVAHQSCKFQLLLPNQCSRCQVHMTLDDLVLNTAYAAA